MTQPALNARAERIRALMFELDAHLDLASAAAAELLEANGAIRVLKGQIEAELSALEGEALASTDTE